MLDTCLCESTLTHIITLTLQVPGYMQQAGQGDLKLRLPSHICMLHNMANSQI